MYCNQCGKEIPDSSKFCPECGAQFDTTTETKTVNVPPSTTVNVNMQSPQTKVASDKPSGSITRLVLGIITTVLGGIAFFQSCAVSSLENVGEAFGAENNNAGGGGMFVALLMVAAGIVAIATRRGKPGGIVAGAIMIVAGFIGIGSAANFSDMGFYGGFCLIAGAAILVVSIVFGGKGKKI